MTDTAFPPPQPLERPLGEIPFLRLAQRTAVFRERARRLRVLAQGHAMKDFLLLMADVCEAQQAALNAFPTVPLPAQERLEMCLRHGMPPLSVQSWPRHPAWRQALGQIVDQVRGDAPPGIRIVLERLQCVDGASLELAADAILSGRYQEADLAIAPFVAAALQVYWTHMVTTLGDRGFARAQLHSDDGDRSDVANLCPACASPPVASVVRIGGAEHGIRYLNCSLCETQWHMVRVKCSNCESTKGISYYSIEGSSGAIKAESCDQCDAYLKIAYMEKDPHVDPVADDLATLALDLLMDSTGKSRSGPNLLLMMAN